jgi:hypothetical protein
MNIVVELQQHIDSSLVEDLLVYYRTMKAAYLQKDWEKAGLNGGKFAETVTRILQHLTSTDGSFESGSIRVDQELRQITNLPRGSCHDTLRLRIPRVALTVYDIRNSRNIAHSSREVDPNYMDSFLVVSACDWILAELVRVYLPADTGNALQQIIQRIIERQVPIVQEIDSDVVVLNPDLTYKDQLVAVLYSKYPERVSNEELRKWTNPKHNSYVSQYLRSLEDERLVHRNNQGSVLTLAGLRYVEDRIPTAV